MFASFDLQPGICSDDMDIQDSAAFKPTNNLFRNSRESGSVRAQGKSQLDPEPASRSRKRQCNNDQSRFHDLTTDRSALRFSRPQPSLGSNQSSRTAERGTRPRQHEEFRGVEHSVKMPKSYRNRSPQSAQWQRVPAEDSADERFTSEAARSRRAAINLEANSSKDEAMSPVSSKVPRRRSISRESPDELQGGVTTQQLPRYMNSNQKPQNTNSDSLLSPSRKRSPSDIRPTDFASSPSQGPKRAKRSHGSSKSFNVRSIHIGSEKQQGGKLVFQPDRNRLEFLGNPTKSDDSFKILVRNITTAVVGDERSSKVTLKLSKDINSSIQKVNIQFIKISDKDGFATLIENNVKIQERSMEYMNNAFNHHESEMDALRKASKMPLIESVSSEPKRECRVPSTRQKLSSSLQGDSEDPPKEEINPKKRYENSLTCQSSTSLTKITRDMTITSRSGDKTGVQGSKTKWSTSNDKDDQSEIEIPIKKFKPIPESERQTRSVGRRSTRLSDISIKQRDDDDASSNLSLKDDPFRKEWKQPLVYPPNGKKKAEVTLEDRNRLSDDDFLNDNLIAFYMRFLQDHLERTNKEAAKQVYFFNSYFYDTLTKVSKGRQEINYSGVAKWTRNVDLFSYKYVVVPINHNAHWFLAIICNLPGLLGEDKPNEAKDDDKATPTPSNAKESSTQPGKEVHEILESPEPEANLDRNRATRSPDSQPSKATRDRLASILLEHDPGDAKSAERVAKEHEKGQQQPEESQSDEIHTSKKPPELTSADEWPTEDDHRPSPFKFTTGLLNKKEVESKTNSAAAPQASPLKKGKAGQKLSPDRATIITFDSLDQARTPAIRILREYICEESVSKRGKEVDPKHIKGMRARQIPLQPNWSDCGLYLLAYLEKFVQGPHQFITKLLRREMDEKKDWPPLGSGLLRQRLRDFLDQLYQEQGWVKGSKIETQQLLVDQEPVSYLLGPSSSGKAEVEKEVDGTPEKSKQLSDGNKKAENETTKETTAEPPPEPYKSESESDSGDSSEEDQLQLVPNGRLPATASREHSPPSSLRNSHEIDPREKKKDEDVVEVPDSQPSKSLDSINTKSKKSNVEEGVAKAKSQDNKQSKVDHDLGQSKVNKSAKIERPRVEIQIRATPPPSPVRARKSPRGTRQKR